MRRIRGAFGRWRRRLRTAVLRPVLIGNRTFRETVMNAVAERGHLIYTRKGDLSFFVDPGDRAVGAELRRMEAERQDLFTCGSCRLTRVRIPPNLPHFIRVPSFAKLNR